MNHCSVSASIRMMVVLLTASTFSYRATMSDSVAFWVLPPPAVGSGVVAAGLGVDLGARVGTPVGSDVGSSDGFAVVAPAVGDEEGSGELLGCGDGADVATTSVGASDGTSEGGSETCDGVGPSVGDGAAATGADVGVVAVSFWAAHQSATGHRFVGFHGDETKKRARPTTDSLKRTVLPLLLLTLLPRRFFMVESLISLDKG